MKIMFFTNPKSWLWFSRGKIGAAGPGRFIEGDTFQVGPIFVIRWRSDHG